MYFRTDRELNFYKLLHPDFDGKAIVGETEDIQNCPLNIEKKIEVLFDYVKKHEDHSILYKEVKELLKITFLPKDFSLLYYLVGTCFESESDYDVAVLYYAFSLRFYRDQKIVERICSIYENYYHKDFTDEERQKIVELSYGFMKRQSNLKFQLSKNLIQIWHDKPEILKLLQNISEKIN